MDPVLALCLFLYVAGAAAFPATFVLVYPLIPREDRDPGFFAAGLAGATLVGVAWPLGALGGLWSFARRAARGVRWYAGKVADLAR